MSEFPMYRKRKTLNGVEYVKIMDEGAAASIFVSEDTWYKGQTINRHKIAEMGSATVISKHEWNGINKFASIRTND